MHFLLIFAIQRIQQRAIEIIEIAARVRRVRGERRVQSDQMGGEALGQRRGELDPPARRLRSIERYQNVFETHRLLLQPGTRPPIFAPPFSAALIQVNQADRQFPPRRNGARRAPVRIAISSSP
jgi:hypothetical protein